MLRLQEISARMADVVSGGNNLRRPAVLRDEGIGGRKMRANVIFGTAGETILQQRFEQKIAEPRHAGPTLYVALTMRSEIEAISPLLDKLMPLVKLSHCGPGHEQDVEIALREALANAVLHGNKQDAQKKVHISARVRPGKGVSIVIKDEGCGFDPTHVPDPTTVENINSQKGRGICMMNACMDEVRFDQGGTQVRLQKAFK
jgi:serine/threonine-protein kinase RsbW